MRLPGAFVFWHTIKRIKNDRLVLAFWCFAQTTLHSLLYQCGSAPGRQQVSVGGTAVRMAQAPTPPQYHWAIGADDDLCPLLRSLVRFVRRTVAVM